MNQKDILLKRKERKDKLKKKNRRKKYKVKVRYISERTFEVLGYDEKDAIIKSMSYLFNAEPKETQVIDAVIKRDRKGIKSYDFHFNFNDLDALSLED